MKFKINSVIIFEVIKKVWCRRPTMFEKILKIEI